MSEAQIPHVFRGAVPADIPLILDAWLSETRHSAFARHMENRVYRAKHHKLAERLLKRSKVLVMCNPDDHNHIFGFCVFEELAAGPYIHWLYVKQPLRNQGLARALVQFIAPTVLTETAPNILCSHTGKLFVRKPVLDSEGRKTGDTDNETVKRYRLIYDPYIMFGDE